MPRPETNWARVGALAKRIITQFRRDRRTLALVFIVPTIVLSLVAYFIKIEAPAVPIGVVNEDQGALGAQLTEALKQSGALKVVEISRDQADEQIKSGEIEAWLIFPDDFTEGLQTSDPANVDLTLEGSNPQTNAKTISNVSRSITGALAHLGFPSAGPGDEASPITMSIGYVYGGEQFDTFDYFGPAFIGFFAFFFVFLLTCVSFLRERTQGTMERLMASPLTKAEIVFGYMLGFSVFAFVQSSFILLFTILVLRIHYVGNPLILFVIVVILTVVSVNLGIFLSTFAKTELQAVQFIPLIIIPQALLSGIFWAVEDLHEVLQWLAHALPLTYANFALRDVMIKGYGLGDSAVVINILILALFAGAMILLAAFTLRREVA